MNTIAWLAAVLLTACAADPAPASHPAGALDTAALARRSLGGSSLAEMQLLASPAGRDALSHVVACALPDGASLTAIARDGTPYSFTGRAGLAPGWAQRPATADERARVTACVLAHTSGVVRA
jgi:hypothetical protein